AGPAGLWVLEIKAYQGAYRASGERWDRYSGGRWQKMPKSPGVQVATNAGMLSNFLKENGAQLWVEPVVV
ncbi:MAG TPA: nuclease-related domain-containing protein, partial [Candidatus Limnocylindrales bacterium]|nr:nuclease-related domain-containing protein [Candidatus Limnocylindrales bacterium]